MVDKHSDKKTDSVEDVGSVKAADAVDDAPIDQETDNVTEIGDAAETGPASQDPLVLNEQLEAARAAVVSLTDQSLRSQADAENARRRAARDVENAHKFALDKFAADLLPVLDSLEKAVQVADDAEAAPGSAIGEGVALSLKLFIDVLEKAGISQIDPVGEPFDPQLHEAMAMVPNPDSEPNSVLEVMQKGYLLNGRLVRAAMVVVSKAP